MRIDRSRLSLRTALRTREVRVGIGVVLAFALGLTGLYMVRTSHAATYTVCPVGCTYTSISAAVAAAAPNAVVTVGPGIYGPATGDTTITLTQGITLQGAGAGVSIINTGGTATLPSGIYGTINVTVPNPTVAARAFTIEGFTIEGASTNNGAGEPFLIEIEADTNPGDSFTITNNQFLESPTLDPNLATDFSVGVYSLGSTASFSVTNNVFNGMWQGAFFEEPISQITITGNDFNGLIATAGYWPEGVFLLADGGVNATSTHIVSGNTFENYAGMGIGLEGGYASAVQSGTLSNVTVQGNTINLQGATDGAGSAPGIFVRGSLNNPPPSSPSNRDPFLRPGAAVRAHLRPSATVPGVTTPNGVITNTSLQGNVIEMTNPGMAIRYSGDVETGNSATGNLIISRGGTASPAGINFDTMASPALALAITGNQVSGFVNGVAADTHLQAGSALTFSQNCIYGNSLYGMNNGATTSITAQQNWWGAASGPNPPGSGDAVAGAIDASNFLTAPATVCQGPVTSGVSTGAGSLLVGNPISLSASVSDATTGNFPIASAQYNLDGANYTAMSAQDSTFDTATEAVSATIPPIGTPGAHTVCVRGTDLGGNTGTPACATITVLVPTSLGLQGNGSNIFALRNSNTTGIANTTLAFGQAGDIPLAGDWTGKGYDSVGVYRPSNSTFYLRNTNTSGQPDITILFGAPGDIPVVGDWNGDGTDTIGVWNPTNHVFSLRNSNTAGPADINVVYGSDGDLPVVGDWSGKGYDSIGIYRPSSRQFLLRNSNTSGSADIMVTYGATGDTPIVGDWTHQGKTTIGVYRSSTNKVYLRNSNTTGSADIGYTYGSGSGLTPVTGAWQTVGLTRPGGK